MQFRVSRSSYARFHDDSGGQLGFELEVQLYGQGVMAQFPAFVADLVAFADLIYRLAGQQPRELGGAGAAQTVRIEVVQVPVGALPAPIEQQPVDEVGQIKLRMLRGG